MPELPLPDAVVFIAASLDGFIAREDGGLDWLVGSGEGGADSAPSEEDYGYGAFIASVDTLVLGRASFEKVLTSGAWPYEGLRIVVLSTGSPTVPDALQPRVEVLALEPEALLRHLAATGTRRAWVDGGQAIQRFLRARLIRELTLTRAPVLLGSGIPLFGALPGDIALDHVETRAFSNGLVQSRYRVLSAP